MIAAEPQYYIYEGVRRSVAARELGLPVINAVLVREGYPDTPLFVPLGRLHSSKPAISRSHKRYLDVHHALSTIAGRSTIDPIIIQPLGARAQSGSTPLHDVLLEP